MRTRDHFKKQQRSGYIQGRYRNPHLTNTKTKAAKFRFLRGLLWLPVLTGLILFLNFLLRSPVYSISEVRVIGAEFFSAAEISQIAEEYLNQPRLLVAKERNRFIFNEQGLAKKLGEKYAFEKLEISVQQNTLLIQIEEKTSNLLWYSRGQVSVADLTGTLVRSLTTQEANALKTGAPEEEDLLEPLSVAELRSLPKFKDLNDLGAEPGALVLTPEEIQNIFRFHELLKQQGLDFTETRLDRLAGKWMSVRTTKGYDILFDALGDIEAQAQNLFITLNENIGERTDIKYIDLRFGDRVYYK